MRESRKVIFFLSVLVLLVATNRSNAQDTINSVISKEFEVFLSLEEAKAKNSASSFSKLAIEDLPVDYPLLVNEDILIDQFPDSYGSYAATSSYRKGNRLKSMLGSLLFNKTYCAIYFDGSSAIQARLKEYSKTHNGLKLLKGSVLHFQKIFHANSGTHLIFALTGPNGEYGLQIPAQDAYNDPVVLSSVGIYCQQGAGSYFKEHSGDLKMKSLLYHFGGRLVLP